MPATTDASLLVATHDGRAMGSRLAIEVHGATDTAVLAGVEVAVATIQRLEERWSRFVPDSEISRCNATRGLPVFVSPDTRTLVRHGVAAWHRTDGACDPSVIDALVATGYDRSLEQLLGAPTTSTTPPIATTQASPGCGGIEIDDHLGAVTMPLGVGFDPGAIGKGLAADLAAEEVMATGAHAVAVSIGGDMRLAGTPNAGDGWRVDICEPSIRPQSFGHIALTEGAVATSTTRKRRWGTGQERRHHLIDPATGTTAQTTAIMATVVTGAGWWAEALATQLLLARPEEWATVVDTDAALIVDDSGAVHLLGAMRELLR